ncbi:MAG: type II toxin-antitoxin system HicB family antitoxin [Deferrisomatales bacterium]
MQLTIELEREEDGRWIAEIPLLPGVLCYAGTREDALAKVEALALRVMAERLDHGDAVPELAAIFSVAA